VVNRERFDSVPVRHEYFLLEKECFGRLGDEDQRVILGRIDQGPTYTDGQLKNWLPTIRELEALSRGVQRGLSVEN
jgi:hypothetical protein